MVRQFSFIASALRQQFFWGIFLWCWLLLIFPSFISFIHSISAACFPMAVLQLNNVCVYITHVSVEMCGFPPVMREYQVKQLNAHINTHRIHLFNRNENRRKFTDYYDSICTPEPACAYPIAQSKFHTYFRSILASLHFITQQQKLPKDDKKALTDCTAFALHTMLNMM